MVSTSLYLSDLRNSFSKKYTLDEYLLMVRTKEENIRVRENLKNFDVEEHIAKKILSNPRAKQLFGFVAGSLLFIKDTVVKAATEPSLKGLDKVDTAGGVILSVMRRIGYWVLLVMCILEVLKCVANGDTKEIGKIIMKYLLAFMVLFLIPWAFGLVIGIFS
jgi:hypothetical protein